jgi:CNP1-like family
MRLSALPVRRWVSAAALALCCTGTWGQFAASDPNWQESAAPAAPAFDLQRLVPFDVSLQSELKWGFDPETMHITGDGIVRYVVVAQSPSGVVNAMYEAMRCATGEWKTYARHHQDSGWTPVAQPQWRNIRSLPKHHAMRLAQQGMCTGAAPASSVREVVRSVRQ